MLGPMIEAFERAPDLGQTGNHSFVQLHYANCALSDAMQGLKIEPFKHPITMDPNYASEC